MVDYTNPVCLECPHESACNFPCLNYSNYLIRQHMEKETNNIQNSIKTLDLAKNTDVHKKNNPYVARVTEVDISLQTGVSWGNGLTPQKKEQLKEIMGKYSGKAGLSEMVMVNRNHCDDIADYLEYDVSDPIWLRVIHGISPWIDLIDKSAFMDYLEEQNRIFCDKEGLCPECRSQLERYESKEEVWGSMQTIEVLPVCPNGCI